MRRAHGWGRCNAHVRSRAQKRQSCVPLPVRVSTGRSLSGNQLAAIRAVMRLFVEDDLAQGVSPRDRIECVACAAVRPAPGFVTYDGSTVCNACATAYEIDRARGLVRVIGEFLAHRTGRDDA